MNSLIGRTPFLRLLIPVIIGIVASAFLPFESAYWLPISLTGLAAMLLSLFVQKEKRYKARWLFGAGFSLFLCAFASLLYQEAEKDAAYDFPESEAYFIGTILDIPEVKPRSMACHIETTYPIKKRVLLYLELSNEARQLAPGDELVFRARMRPFQNMGNPDDFDYVRFMQIKDFPEHHTCPVRHGAKQGENGSISPSYHNGVEQDYLTSTVRSVWIRTPSRLSLPSHLAIKPIFLMIYKKHFALQVPRMYWP